MPSTPRRSCSGRFSARCWSIVELRSCSTAVGRIGDFFIARDQTTLLAYNLIRRIICAAAFEHGKEPRGTSGPYDEKPHHRRPSGGRVLSSWRACQEVAKPKMPSSRRSALEPNRPIQGRRVGDRMLGRLGDLPAPAGGQAGVKAGDLPENQVVELGRRRSGGRCVTQGPRPSAPCRAPARSELAAHPGENPPAGIMRTHRSEEAGSGTAARAVVAWSEGA